MSSSSLRDRAACAAAGLVMTFACASSGCSSAPPPAEAADGGFPTTPLLTVNSSSGELVIAVRTSPQPPSVGTDQVQYTITKASDGTPVDGLTLAVQPIMPSMGHGTSATPVVTPQGDGVYVVSNLYLFMQGVWALGTTISGPLSDYVSPDIQLQ
jgi:hypothetical protein